MLNKPAVCTPYLRTGEIFITVESCGPIKTAFSIEPIKPKEINVASDFPVTLTAGTG